MNTIVRVGQVWEAAFRGREGFRYTIGFINSAGHVFCEKGDHLTLRLDGTSTVEETVWTKIADAPGESAVSPAGRLAELEQRMEHANKLHDAGLIGPKALESIRQQVMADLEAPEVSNSPVPETIPAPKDEPNVYGAKEHLEWLKAQPPIGGPAMKSPVTHADRLGELESKLTEVTLYAERIARKYDRLYRWISSHQRNQFDAIVKREKL